MVAYITLAEFGDVEREQLHWNDGEDALKTIDLRWNLDHLVRVLLRFFIALVTYDDRLTLQSLIRQSITCIDIHLRCNPGTCPDRA